MHGTILSSSQCCLEASSASFPKSALSLVDYSNAWMLRGIQLLNDNTPASLRHSIVCFDRAIELRRPWVLANDPWFRFGLIAGWMNRADALTRLGSAEELIQAMSAHDTALAQLQLLPIDHHPHFRRRLAIAWTNRGITLRKQGTVAAFQEALRSFDEAILALEASPGGIGDRALLLAGALVNRASTLLSRSPSQPEAALDSARTALREINPIEQADATAAEIGLQARQVLCQVAGRLLTERRAVLNHVENVVHEATDAVEEGLQLARHWAAKAMRTLGPQPDDLFRFGVFLYQQFQPHFLSEFVLEYLQDGQEASPAAAAAAREALARSFRELQGCAIESVRTPQFTRLLERLEGIRTAAARLAKS